MKVLFVLCMRMPLVQNISKKLLTQKRILYNTYSYILPNVMFRRRKINHLWKESQQTAATTLYVCLKYWETLHTFFLFSSKQTLNNKNI